MDVSLKTPRRQSEQGEALRVAPGGQRLLARFSLAHGLMVLSGLLAFVLVASLAGERGERIEVAVADGDIAAGTALAADHWDTAELPADSTLAQTMLSAEVLGEGRWVTARPISAGEPLLASDVTSGVESPGLRRMSIPVSRQNAVGGELRVGDRIDVIDVVDGTGHFVVTDAQVVHLPSNEPGAGLTSGATREFFLVVEVDAAEALALAEALSDASIDVVRSSGAEPVSASARGARG